MIILGLGANLPSNHGSIRETLEHAIRQIDEGPIQIIQRSSFYSTAPVPFDPTQPRFLNAVITIATELEPRALLERLLAIEKSIGRDRGIEKPTAQRSADRPIDLDLLAYGSLIIDQPNLTIPHPRMNQRSFVLVPLVEILPNWVHPALRKSASSMLLELEPDGDIQKL